MTVTTEKKDDFTFAHYKMPNPIPSALLNNTTIDDVLHVIAVVSNPCEYKRRWQLAQQFEKRMIDTSNVCFYMVELIYPGQEYHVTDSDNPNHLQIKTDHPIWHKECMVNVGVKHLLPASWKAFAWIDADVLFENTTWVQDTLKLLNGTCDIVQLFSHAIDMDAEENAMTIFQGSMYQYINKQKRDKGIYYWHPGYAWACTREAYDKMGGLFEYSILGSGDDNMMKTWIGEKSWLTSIHGNATDGYKKSLKQYSERCKGFKLGYVPGIIRHYFHGSKKNRKYVERWQTLLKWKYDPLQHITKDGYGVLIPTETFPCGLLKDIMAYFKERNEDEAFV